jgi:transposase-like protein
MQSKLSCPRCNRSVSTKPLKAWRFGAYEVKRYECEHCKSKFNVYRGAKGTFTIPKRK